MPYIFLFSTFLVGIIPGPNELRLHINSFLEPLVEDLQQLWKGVEMTTPEGVKTVHAALLCTSSDIPATRKLCGFVGHGAVKGCSRCLKSFPTAEFGTKPDYSGFQRSTWPRRDLSICYGMPFNVLEGHIQYWCI